MKVAGTVISLILSASVVYAEEFIYEFGANEGQVIYNNDGNIPLLKWNTDVDIPIPPGMTVMYVKVKVHSISSPKVDYNALYHRVNIKFTWTQVTLASYNIQVKAIYALEQQ